MKLGIALSGGGVKGAAHIGVLKALHENGIIPCVIGGTSSGSIVAALYAIGYTPDEIHNLFEYFSKSVIEADPKYYVTSVRQNRSFRISGLLSGENIEKAIREACSYKNINKINEIPMPVAIPSVDAVTGKEYVFTNVLGDNDKYIYETEIPRAVRASASFPGVYAPCVIGKYKFLDGGILDNVPTKEVRRMGADKIISVKFKQTDKFEGNSIYSILLRTVDIMTDAIANDNTKTSDIILDVDTGKVSLLGIDKLDQCEQKGYEETIRNIDKIKQMLNK